MEALYLIATIIFIFVSALTLSLAIREAIEQESIFRFFIWLMTFMLSVGITLYCIDIVCKDSDRALSNCIELGYQSTQYYNNSWYCVTYGNEPKIIKLEGEQ